MCIALTTLGFRRFGGRDHRVQYNAGGGGAGGHNRQSNSGYNAQSGWNQSQRPPQRVAIQQVRFYFACELAKQVIEEYNLVRMFRTWYSGFFRFLGGNLRGHARSSDSFGKIFFEFLGGAYSVKTTNTFDFSQLEGFGRMHLFATLDR